MDSYIHVREPRASFQNVFKLQDYKKRQIPYYMYFLQRGTYKKEAAWERGCIGRRFPRGRLHYLQYKDASNLFKLHASPNQCYIIGKHYILHASSSLLRRASLSIYK
jgi:hypothetical protein